MSDIFKEIEQEIRRDDALKLWNKYQIPVYVLAVLIVAAVAAWRYWDYRREQQAEAEGARYEAALQLGAQGKAQVSLEALRTIAQGQGGYALLARFAAANAQSAKNPAAASAAYDAIAADPRMPRILQNLARLRAAFLHMDDADPKDAEQRLERLVGPTDAFHASAREQLAVLALKRKDYQAAGRWLDMIVADPLSPAALRSRAESLEGLVAGSGPPPAPTKAKAAPAAPAAKAAPAHPAAAAAAANSAASAANPAAP